MATTLLKFGPFQGTWIFGWDLASGEVGFPANVAAWADKTVQIYGTFATGALSLEGALDPTTPIYTVLRDLPGAAISAKVAAYLEAIQQHVTFIRPVATTITAVSVRIICTAARARTA
jgi:hypothetical protein